MIEFKYNKEKYFMKKTNLFNSFIRIWGIILIVGFVVFTAAFISQNNYIGLRQFYLFTIGAVGCSAIDCWCVRKYGKYIAKIILRE